MPRDVAEECCVYGWRVAVSCLPTAHGFGGCFVFGVLELSSLKRVALPRMDTAPSQVCVRERASKPSRYVQNCTCSATWCASSKIGKVALQTSLCGMICKMLILSVLTRLRGMYPTLSLYLQNQLESDSIEQIFNLTNYMVWADEDFIGRISRLSRRAHKLTTHWRTLQRAKCLYLRQWSRNFGLHL